MEEWNNSKYPEDLFFPSGWLTRVMFRNMKTLAGLNISKYSEITTVPNFKCLAHIRNCVWENHRISS